MLKYFGFIAGSIVFSLSIAGSAGAEPLKVGHSVWVGFGPLYIAKEKGFFQDEGADIKLISLGDLEVSLCPSKRSPPIRSTW